MIPEKSTQDYVPRDMTYLYICFLQRRMLNSIKNAPGDKMFREMFAITIDLRERLEI